MGKIVYKAIEKSKATEENLKKPLCRDYLNAFEMTRSLNEITQFRMDAINGKCHEWVYDWAKMKIRAFAEVES